MERQLQHLKRQSVAAEKYGELKQQERKTTANLNAMRWRSLDDEIRANQESINSLEINIESTAADQRAIDAKVEKQLALASLMLSAIGLFALFGLGFFEIYSGPLRQLCLWWSRLASGAGMMLIASVPLAIAALRLHRRYRWTDMLHAVLLIALIMLWGMII